MCRDIQIVRVVRLSGREERWEVRVRDDLSGRKFGRLTVVRFDSVRNKSHSMWLCDCDCGKTAIVSKVHLVSGRQKSCGCLRREASRIRKSTHGMYNSPTYNSWANMIQRCTNKNSHKYPDYGGRGITFDSSWIRFESFLEDMGERPNGTTLDRRDNDGNYEPSNCRWATIDQQANNKRNNRIIEYQGESLTMAQWAKKLGINYGTLQTRIDRCGWSVEDALSGRD